LRRSLLALALAALLGGCDEVHWGAPIACDAPAASVTAPAPDGALGVLTWNLHGTPDSSPADERFTRVADAIRVRGPHLALLQEVWFEAQAAQLERGLANAYLRVADDSEVTASLAMRVAGQRRGGLLAFVRSDVEAGASTFARFRDHAPWTRLWEGDGLASKGWQRFTARIEGRPLRVFHTHVQAGYRGRPYADVRASQLRQLAAALEADPGTAIVAGDLNSSLEEAQQARLLAPPVVDLAQPLRAGASATTVGGVWIDHVLGRGGDGEPLLHPLAGELIRSESVDCPYSDHHGVLVWLAW
jgi:endonuclease/exonuclease/phosphatase family metal-dependent hydrolase